MGLMSLMEETHKFAEKLDESLALEYPEPWCQSMSNPETEIIGPNVKEHLEKADMEGLKETINEERWHRRLLQEGVKEDRWQDSALGLRGCFTWLRDWPCAPTHTIAGIRSSVSTYTHSGE